MPKRFEPWDSCPCCGLIELHMVRQPWVRLSDEERVDWIGWRPKPQGFEASSRYMYEVVWDASCKKHGIDGKALREKWFEVVRVCIGCGEEWGIEP